MYKKVNLNENTLKVLSLFTNGFNQHYYIREIAALLKISPRTSQIILAELEEKGIIESKTRGKIKEYALRNNSTALRYIVLAEQYKAISFFGKQALIAEAVDQISSCIDGIGIIFGSYAKGLQNKSSDLDIFVIGSIDTSESKKISKKFGIDINSKCCTLKVFEESIGSDYLVNEVIKSHIAFVGAEQFANAVMKNGQNKLD